MDEISMCNVKGGVAQGDGLWPDCVSIELLFILKIIILGFTCRKFAIFGFVIFIDAIIVIQYAFLKVPVLDTGC